MTAIMWFIYNGVVLIPECICEQIDDNVSFRVGGNDEKLEKTA
jgi:hypothetical protein